MGAGAVTPAATYAAVVAKGKSASSQHDPDSPPLTPDHASPKGKARDSRVNFADSSAPNERTALLRQQTSSSSGNGDDEEQDDEEEDGGFIARTKRALGLGKGDRDSLPLYAEDGRTQRPIRLNGGLGALLALLLIAVLVGGALLVRSGNHDTGPSPHPPTPAYPMPTGGSSGPRNPAYLIKAEHGAVASEAQVCSQIGVDVLKDGGNAIDAAIASNLCVGTVNPFSAGIGGQVIIHCIMDCALTLLSSGGFMVIRIPPSSPTGSSSVHSIDFRETAPTGSNSSMFTQSPLLSKFGGLSVAVPGEIRGLHAAHSQFGRLPWSRLFEPSIQLANGGWKVTAELDRRIRLFGKGWMENDKDWSPIFAPGGKLLKQGDWIKRQNFSYTLSSIANEGPDAFYKAGTRPGTIAASLVGKIQATGGIMTLQDLESYKVIQRPALKSTYQGRHVYTTHAPSSGPVLIHVLNALERFGSGPNVHDQVAMKKEGGLWWHRVTEALKFGSAARTRLGDPDFGNNHKLMAEIPTKKFGDKVSARITDDTTHTPEYYNPIYDVQIDHGTTHTSAADAEGFAIALTSSVNLIWGSRVMDPATGVILNDVMDDFSTPGLPNMFGLWPSPWNYPEAGKRQVSSMAPTIMEYASGKLYLTLGGSGGSRIFGAIAQTIVNLDRGMNVSGAIEEPRVHDQLFPTLVSIESEFGERELEGLKQRGHNTSVFDINLGVAEIQAVTLDEDGHIFAASDSRKNGVAAGW